ncbi:MAG: transporter substrate-binding domain-containing protein [Chthoniobacterales bacterium]|nr:transporter substrate-binding domain-containing protein [Chthoniobacterales bacterium]
MKKHILLLTALLGATNFHLAAQAAPLRVAVKPAEPFAFEQNGVLTGYSVDLWKKAAAEAGYAFEMRVVSTVPELLDAVQNGSADVGVGAISITPERERLMDFSHPFYKSGLQVMARAKGEAGAFSAFRSLLNRNVGEVVVVLLLAVFLVSHILWIVERKINAESFPEGYVRGVSESTWWSIATLISGGCENKSPVGVAGRLVAVVWMLGGIGLTSYITATLASAMTVNTLSAEISGLTDLRGARVGTIAGSSAEGLLKRTGLDVVGYPDIAAAADALGNGTVKGVVYDSPILRYYVAQNPAAGFSLVGKAFDLQDYGFAMQLGSPLRKELNAALLKLQVAGWTDELEKKWFEAPAAE